MYISSLPIHLSNNFYLVSFLHLIIHAFSSLRFDFFLYKNFSNPVIKPAIYVDADLVSLVSPTTTYLPIEQRLTFLSFSFLTFNQSVALSFFLNLFFKSLPLLSITLVSHLLSLLNCTLSAPIPLATLPLIFHYTLTIYSLVRSSSL